MALALVDDTASVPETKVKSKSRPLCVTGDVWSINNVQHKTAIKAAA